IRARYVAYRRTDFLAQAEVPESAITDYYELHKDDRFTEPEQVHARHILVKVANDAGEPAKTAARKKAEDLLAKVRAGGDFAALARKNSDDPGSAAKGGDLGFFGRGTMTPAFESAAFALESGKVSDVVETPFGFHILRTDEHKPGGVKPLDAVRDEIVQTLRGEQALELARKQAEADRRAVVRGKSLAEAAAGRAVEETLPFAAADELPGVGRVQAPADARASHRRPGAHRRRPARAEGVRRRRRRGGRGAPGPQARRHERPRRRQGRPARQPAPAETPGDRPRVRRLPEGERAARGKARRARRPEGLRPRAGAAGLDRAARRRRHVDGQPACAPPGGHASRGRDRARPVRHAAPPERRAGALGAAPRAAAAHPACHAPQAGRPRRCGRRDARREPELSHDAARRRDGAPAAAGGRAARALARHAARAPSPWPPRSQRAVGQPGAAAAQPGVAVDRDRRAR